MANYMLIVIAVIFGVVRFFMPSHALSAAGSYEAFAHLFLGGLIGAWLISKERFYLFLILALSLVETVAFFTKG